MLHLSLAPVFVPPALQGQARGSPVPLEALIWVAVLLGTAIVGGLVILAFRGRLLGRRSAGDDASSRLTELKRLRDAGRLSAEEFESARAAIISSLSGAAPRRISPRIIDPDGTVRARPGLDLTGQPLPDTRRSGPDKDREHESDLPG